MSGSLSLDSAGRLTITAVDVGITSVVPGVAATNLGKAEDAAHTSADVGVFVLALRTDTAASSAGTTGDYAALNTDSIGRLWVTGTALEDVAHSSGDQGHVALTKRTDTAATSAGTDGDYATLNSDANGKLWVNVGAVGSGATDLAKLEDAAHASGDAGVVALARYKAAPTASSVTDGDYVTQDSNAQGAQYVQALPGVAGGLLISKTIAAATTNATVVKASPGHLYKLVVNNQNAAVRYLKLYNVAASPTVGTTVPVMTIALPPGILTIINFGPTGLAFGTGIAFSLNTGVADNDTGAVSANEHVVNVGYF